MSRVAIAAVVIVVAGWAASGIPFVTYARRPTPRPRPLPAVAEGVDAAMTGLKERTTRLRSAMVSPRPLPAATRNPFQFRERHAVQPTAFAEIPRPPALTTAGVQGSRPELQLIGIAEDGEAGDPVRTAVVSGADQLFLVKVGDRVAGRFTVVKIGADAVLLTDVGTGESMTLRLR